MAAVQCIFVMLGEWQVDIFSGVLFKFLRYSFYIVTFIIPSIKMIPSIRGYLHETLRCESTY